VVEHSPERDKEVLSMANAVTNDTESGEFVTLTRDYVTELASIMKKWRAKANMRANRITDLENDLNDSENELEKKNNLIEELRNKIDGQDEDWQEQEKLIDALSQAVAEINEKDERVTMLEEELEEANDTMERQLAEYNDALELAKDGIEVTIE
jgi:chromosome segregation ATPase